MVAPTVGALLAEMFNYPEYLGTHLALTFGRLRPVHTWCHDGEGGGIVDGSRLNTSLIGLLTPSGSGNGICVTAHSV